MIKSDCVVTTACGLFSPPYSCLPLFIPVNKLKNVPRDEKVKFLFMMQEISRLSPWRTSTQRKLSEQNIDDITAAYHSFRNHEKKAVRKDGTEISYADQTGFCKITTLNEIRAKDYNLTPASYVGIVMTKQDTEPFEVKMDKLTKRLSAIMVESKQLDVEIAKQLEDIGWKI